MEMELLREIPDGSVEIQVGLWAKAETLTLGSMTRTFYDLYSAQGYCFYLPENNLDEDGNLRPENERTYYQYMSTAYQSVEQINENVVSVPVQEDYEIANTGSGNHETAEEMANSLQDDIRE